MNPDRMGLTLAGRRLGTQTLVMLLGYGFTLAVGLPLQIFVSRTLGADTLGVFGVIDAAMVTASGFLGLGIASTAVRFIPAHLERREYASVKALVGWGGTVLTVIGAAAYAVLLAVVARGGSLWPLVTVHRNAVLLMGLTIPLGLVLFFLQQSLRGFQDIRYIVLGSSVVQLLTKAVITILAFALGIRLEGYALAIVLAMTVATVWMGRGLRRRLASLPSESGDGPTRRGAWWRFASVSYRTSLIAVVSGRIDWFVLGYFAGVGAVGIAVVVGQLQHLPATFLQMILAVGAPMFAAAHSRDDRTQRQHLYTLAIDWTMRASLPLVIFLFVFAHPLLALFGPEFAVAGVPILRILVVLQIFNLACGPIGPLAIMSGLEGANLRLGVASTIATTAVMLVVIPKFGLVGWAAASVFGTVVLNISILNLVRRRLGTVWWSRRFLGWLAPAAAAGTLGAAIASSGIALGAVTLAACLVAMYAAFFSVMFLQGLNEDDRDLLLHVIGRLFRRRSKHESDAIPAD